MGTKRVQKTKRVAKTRQVPGINGGFATEVYYVDETVWENVYVSDSGGSSFTSDNSSSSGGYGE